MKRKARCAHPGCTTVPTDAFDGRLFFLGDQPAAWVCAAHAQKADKFIEATSEVLAEGARLAGQRVMQGAANKLAALLFGE